MSTFTAQLDDMVKRALHKAELVVKQSAQEVFEAAQMSKASTAVNPKVNKARQFDMGGNLPVDTSFLRNSFISELNGAGKTKGPDAYVMTIAAMELGDTVFGGWTAEYTLHVEYGTANMPGNFFALQAAQQWQAIVQRNAEKARNL